MAISRQGDGESLAEQATRLASGAWVELGVSGWTSTHGNWAIDPEPLILFTAGLGDIDPRLRDEATDWCVRNWRHISRARLKNLLRDQPEEVQRSFGEFAATVGEHAGITWPGATTPRHFMVTGRSARPPLDRAAMVWLRLRAMFGLGTRAEILRCFLSQDGGWMSIAGLGVATSYTKRNVAEECEALQRAGVLALRARGNRFYYSLARRAELEAFVGALPGIRPDWVAMLNIARELVTLERMAAGSPPGTFPVHVNNALRRIGPDLDSLHVPSPSATARGSDLWPAARELGSACLGRWSAGLAGPAQPTAGTAGHLTIALP